MEVNLMSDRILVKKDAIETITAGGLFIHSEAAEKTFTAHVLAVGSGVVTKNGVVIPPSVTVGDKILYQPKAGVEVRLKDENLLVLKEEEILAVFEQ